MQATPFPNKLLAAICKHCPVVWFHRHEKYFPASWHYLLTKNKGIMHKDAKGVHQNYLHGADAVRKQLTDEMSGATPRVLLGTTRNESLLLHTGDYQTCDGYDGLDANPSSVLHGDGNDPKVKQVISAYTIGTWSTGGGTNPIMFADVVYTVYFAFDGSMASSTQSHAFDAEEITVRFQYTPTWAKGTAMAVIQQNGIVASQGLSSMFDNWVVARVSGSAHGNFLWYPTSFPQPKNKEADTLNVEFDKTGRIVFYSAVGTHAMYPTAGIQKRLFGLGNDFTGSDEGFLWKPQVVNLFTMDPSEHYVLDVASQKDAEADALYLLGRFCGLCGSTKKNQDLVPWKKGVMNVVTAGDAYLKFTDRGGTMQQVPPDTQAMLVKGGAVAIPILLLLMKVASFFSKSGGGIRVFLVVIRWLLGLVTMGGW